MDPSRCFTTAERITERVASIDHVKDEDIYSLFPGFIPRLRRDDVAAAATRLRELDRRTVESIVGQVPPEWDVPRAVATALCDFILQRARFVAGSIVDALDERIWNRESASEQDEGQ
jgi:hypothetical protein